MNEKRMPRFLATLIAVGLFVLTVPAIAAPPRLVCPASER
jgi:hypothetical protein